MLSELAAGAERHECRAGTAILVEDGPPTPGLWVVLEGVIELLHQPALLDYFDRRLSHMPGRIRSDDVVAKLLSAVPTPKTDPAARAGLNQ